MDAVKYWRAQLNGANTKNITNESQLGGTRNVYTYGLLGFHNWLLGRKFQYKTSIQIKGDTIQQSRINVRLAGVEHLLELSKKNATDKTTFTFLIKEYLAELASNKKYTVVINAIYSIRSFFRENDVDIPFIFRHRIHRSNKSYLERSLSLDDLHQILTVDGIQPIEKAVFLCKFQRGLDSSTLVDRFNFEVWECLLKHFGSDKPDTWDLNSVPVPIKLVRIKTGFVHTGFLDADAITSIIQYLKTRHRKPEIGNALFVDTKKRPITVNWISRRFHKLTVRSGLRPSISGQSINRCTPHEMRDLLKSTLIDSGCRPDVADHVIGHSPKDSYEKQMMLYPESIIREFTKASKRINILSHVQNSIHEEFYNFSNESYGELSQIATLKDHIEKIHENIKAHNMRMLKMEKLIARFCKEYSG